MALHVKGKRRWGRWLFGTIIVLLAIAYSVLWFMTKPLIEQFADEWVEDQKRAGVEIQFSERYVGGFPFDFKLVFDDPVIVAAPAGVRWQGEQVRLHSRPWNFYPMLANWWGEVEGYAPGKSSVQDRFGNTHELDMTSGSRILVAWNADGLTGANLNFRELSAVVDGENFDTDNFVVAVSPSSNLAGAFDVDVSWDDINVPDQWIADGRLGVQDAPAMIAGMASGLLNKLEAGGATEFPMPNALSLGDEVMLFGIPLN